MENPKQQKRFVSAPLAHDKNFREYSGSIQENFAELWENAHDHLVSIEDREAYAALTTDAQRVSFIATFLGLQ